MTRRCDRSRVGHLWPAAAVLVVLLAGSCASESPSALDPTGFGARRVAGLWWLLFWIAFSVFVVVMTLLGWAVARRRGEKTRVRHGDAFRFVAVAGAGIPLVILVTVYAIGLRDLSALGKTPKQPLVTVDIIGHQWWWEVHYAGVEGATANEFHIPVGEPVKVKLRTADVNHSFWVPQLMPKTDLIAGKVNETWLRAEKAGNYRGQCAEYCGLQHAYMAFMVVAQPRAEFDAWLAGLRAPARTPSDDQQRRGQQVFTQAACAACHTIRGTAANGKVGPDLSAVGSRWSLGAGAIPNDRGHLGGWIANPQTVKPGNLMPPQPIAPADLQALLSYLTSLKAPGGM